MRTSRLPAVVEPPIAAARFFAPSPQSMRRLATELRALDDYGASVVAGAMLSARVMWPLMVQRAAIWLMTKRHKCSEYTAWRMVFDRGSLGATAARATIESAAVWAISGTDTESLVPCAGGFSQREVNYIANLLHIITAHRDAIESIAA